MKVDISEKQLEDIIRRDPDMIEKDLKYISHQKNTDKGRIDLLFVDSGNALALAELKIKEDDSMLWQGIDYYDFVNYNFESFSRIYKDFNVKVNEYPRLFLIAPSFSVALLNRIKWIDIPISLYTFQCIEFEDNKGDIIPIFSEITPPSEPDFIEEYTLQDRYDWITNNGIKKLAKKTIDEIMEWDPQRISVDPTQNDISIKSSGSVIAYLNPRRQYFGISTYNENGEWKLFRVQNEKDKDKSPKIS